MVSCKGLFALDHTQWHRPVAETSTWQHTTLTRDKHPFSFCSLSVLCLTALSWLSWLCLLYLLYNTHNTNIHAPGGIRTRNPNKQSAVDTRLRPLGYWDRLFKPAIPAGNSLQTHALDRSATGIDSFTHLHVFFLRWAYQNESTNVLFHSYHWRHTRLT